MPIDNAYKVGTLVPQFNLKVKKGQLVSADLEAVIGPQNTRYPGNKEAVKCINREAYYVIE